MEEQLHGWTIGRTDNHFHQSGNSGTFSQASWLVCRLPVTNMLAHLFVPLIVSHSRLISCTYFFVRWFSQVICSAVTIIQQYFDTALFTWMLVEGILLYIKLVKVFTVNKQYLTYVAIGWGKKHCKHIGHGFYLLGKV